MDYHNLKMGIRICEERSDSDREDRFTLFKTIKRRVK